MIPLAAQRGGGLTWEYYFNFDGGIPPWTSAMSQGTALEALTRGYQASGDGNYLQIAEQALPIFSVAPPTGVRDRTPLGARYLQYSFAPGTDIINAFLQSLIGLYDYAQASGSVIAQRLFAAGNARPRPSCRGSTPARGRCTSPAARTRSTTTSSSPASCRSSASGPTPRSTARRPTASRPT